MKLVTFSDAQARRIGVMSGDAIVDLARADPSLPREMIGLIANWDRCRARVETAARRAADYTIDAVHLHAPVPRPGKILAIGLNYADHVVETGMPMPEHQVWFCKQATAVTGPFDPIQLPRVSKKLDYEAELVVIVGAGGRHISRDTAASAVFGYCVGNDVSVRDWQMRTPQWMLGKSFDTHAPFGPWIVTADEIADPYALGIRCFVNGEKRQESNTGQLIFRLPEQIAHLSQAMTLEPGDMLFTGTPSGVGSLMEPKRWLANGDVVRVEIDRIGAIENRVVAEAG